MYYNRLRKDKAKMALGREQYYIISLQEERYCIQLSFLLEGNNRCFQQRYELFCYIQSKLEQLMSDFMQASTATKAYVPCFYPECNKLHVQLQLLYNGEYQHCPTVEKRIPDDYYCDLFSDQGLDNWIIIIMLLLANVNRIIHYIM